MSPSPYDPSRLATETAGDAPTGNLVLAGFAGLAAALVGALLWATLVSATQFKIGYAAIGIGFLVGWTMRAVGKGRDPVYGYVGAILALLGCVFGDLLTDCIVLAEQVSKPTLFIVSHLTPAMASDLLQATFKPLDALFYVLAMMAGYRNAFIKQGRSAAA